MLHTTRTLLLTAGTAGFVALGTGIAGAQTLEETVPLDALDGDVPPVLDVLPLDGVLDVDPGEVSAEPGVQTQSAPEDGAALEGVSADAPLDTGTENSASLGPLDLTEELLPLSGALAPGDGPDRVLPVGDGGLPLDGRALPGGDEALPAVDEALPGGALPASGGSVPMSAGTSGAADHVAAVAGDTAADLGDMVGLHEVQPDLVGLDHAGGFAEAVPMSGEEGPVTFTGENTDLTGGLGGLIVTENTVPMSEEADRAAAAERIGEAVGAEHTARTAVEPGAGEARTNDDLVGLNGLPELGGPAEDTELLPSADPEGPIPAEPDTDPVADLLSGDLG